MQIVPLSTVFVENALSEIFKCSILLIRCVRAALSASITSANLLSLEFLIRGTFLSNKSTEEVQLFDLVKMLLLNSSHVTGS